MKVLGENESGDTTVLVEYAALRSEQRTRKVPYTTFQKQRGSDRMVPVTTQREQVYTVWLPDTVIRKKFVVPEGEDVTNYLKRQIRKSIVKNKRPTRPIDDAGLGFGDEPSDKPLDDLFGN